MPNVGVYLDDATAEGIERAQRRFLRERRKPPSRSEIVRAAVKEYLALGKPYITYPTQEDEAK